MWFQGDLASTYHDLKRNYVEMCEHILKLQTLKHDLKGDYSHRFDEEVKALTYSVDLFNSKLGMGDVLLRDENNRVVSQCDQLSVAYEKVGRDQNNSRFLKCLIIFIIFHVSWKKFLRCIEFVMRIFSSGDICVRGISGTINLMT